MELTRYLNPMHAEQLHQTHGSPARLYPGEERYYTDQRLIFANADAMREHP